MEEKKEGMKYSLKDPKTGEVKEYEISYSQELQKKTNDSLDSVEKELKKSNQLKTFIIVLGIALFVAGVMIWTNSGIIGYVARRAVCP